jgi:hypothetical protein
MPYTGATRSPDEPPSDSTTPPVSRGPQTHGDERSGSASTVRRRRWLRTLTSGLRRAFDQGLLATTVAEAAARLPGAQLQRLERQLEKSTRQTLVDVRDERVSRQARPPRSCPGSSQNARSSGKRWSADASPPRLPRSHPSSTTRTSPRRWQEPRTHSDPTVASSGSEAGVAGPRARVRGCLGLTGPPRPRPVPDL